jgi:murein DD-endopeptidase MepM/ murein hydrolase activator NlpD
MLRALALLVVLTVPSAAGLASPGGPVGLAGPAGPAAGLASAAGPAGPRAAAAASWAWPVDAPHAISRPFIAPATPYSAGHRGIDIRAPIGVVYAPTAGVVSFVGVVVDRPVVSIRHPGGLVTSYEPVESALAAGEPVRRGDVIGFVVGGHCASPCLHFGVRLNGQYVSPLNYLGGLPHSVLLPTRRG